HATFVKVAAEMSGPVKTERAVSLEALPSVLIVSRPVSLVAMSLNHFAEALRPQFVAGSVGPRPEPFVPVSRLGAPRLTQMPQVVAGGESSPMPPQPLLTLT